MAFTTRSYGDVCVLELGGRFDAQLAPRVQEWQQAAPSPFLVINLAAVHFLDSGALAVLVSGMKRCRQQGGDLRLCQLQQEVRIIFELTNMNRAFVICDSEAEAVASFEN